MTKLINITIPVETGNKIVDENNKNISIKEFAESLDFDKIDTYLIKVSKEIELSTDADNLLFTNIIYPIDGIYHIDTYKKDKKSWRVQVGINIFLHPEAIEFLTKKLPNGIMAWLDIRPSNKTVVVLTINNFPIREQE